MILTASALTRHYWKFSVRMSWGGGIMMETTPVTSVCQALQKVLSMLSGHPVSVEDHLHLRLWVCSKHCKSQWLKLTHNLPSALNSVRWPFDWAQLAGSSSISWAPLCVCDELPVSGTAQLLGGLWSCRHLGHLVSHPPTGQPGSLHMPAGQDPMTKSRSMQGLLRPRLRIGTCFHQCASQIKSQGQPR